MTFEEEVNRLQEIVAQQQTAIDALVCAFADVAVAYPLAARIGLDMFGAPIYPDHRTAEALLF